MSLTQLNKPRRLLLEIKRVPAPLRLCHLRYPLALEQLAKGYVLRGQGHISGVPNLEFPTENDLKLSLRIKRAYATEAPLVKFISY
jgi:hypothetical protein